MAAIRCASRELPWSFWTVLLLTLAADGTILTAHGQPARTVDSRAAQTKAMYLFNFAQFTDWPPTAFADKDSPLSIALLGTETFGDLLERIVHSEKVHGRKLVIQRVSKMEEVKTCHILFVSQSEAKSLEQIEKWLSNKPVLTVSDIDESTYRSVMIRFLMENNKIRFRINLEAVRESKLTLSSKLLRAAQAVGAEN